MIGETLGSYKILAELGAGGMGAVYTAEHTLIGRQAAVKVLLPELSSNKQLVDRFFNEARAAALIKHPGIVDVFDFGYTENGSAYLIMELLEGESLSMRIERGPMDESSILRIARQVATTLADVHATDIIHRDLKPDNIFLVPDSEVPGGERSKVLDFGIAKLSSHRAPGTSKTQTGQVMGSPLYMSPEQCRGAGEVDARTDIYSLGCIMYEMACGQPVFDGEGVGEVIGKQIYEAPVSPRTLNADLSPQVEAIIVRALAKDPDERFATMRDLVAALDQASGAPASADQQSSRIYSEDSVADTVLPSKGATEVEKPKVLTTLGTAATEMDAPEPEVASPPGSSRWRTVAAIAIPLAAGAVALGLSLTRGEGEPAAADPAAEPSPVAEPAPTPEPTAEEPAEPTAAPASEPADQVTVQLVSMPPGAQIIRVSNNERLGTTPFEEKFDQADADLTVRLELTGYIDREIVIPLKGDYREVVTLFKKGGATAQPAAPKPPEPAPQPTATTPPQTTTEEKREWGAPYNPLND